MSLQKKKFKLSKTSFFIDWSQNFLSSNLVIFERSMSRAFLPLHEKLDLHQIYSVQIWCKKVQTKVK